MDSWTPRSVHDNRRRISSSGGIPPGGFPVGGFPLPALTDGGLPEDDDDPNDPNHEKPLSSKAAELPWKIFRGLGLLFQTLFFVSLIGLAFSIVYDVTGDGRRPIPTAEYIIGGGDGAGLADFAELADHVACRPECVGHFALASRWSVLLVGSGSGGQQEVVSGCEEGVVSGGTSSGGGSDSEITGLAYNQNCEVLVLRRDGKIEKCSRTNQTASASGRKTPAGRAGPDRHGLFLHPSDPSLFVVGRSGGLELSLHDDTPSLLVLRERAGVLSPASSYLNGIFDEGVLGRGRRDSARKVLDGVQVFAQGPAGRPIVAADFRHIQIHDEDRVKIRKQGRGDEGRWLSVCAMREKLVVLSEKGGLREADWTDIF